MKIPERVMLLGPVFRRCFDVKFSIDMAGGGPVHSEIPKKEFLDFLETLGLVPGKNLDWEVYTMKTDEGMAVPVACHLEFEDVNLAIQFKLAFL